MADSLTLCSTEVLWVDGCVKNPISQPVTVPVIRSTSIENVGNHGETDRNTKCSYSPLFVHKKEDCCETGDQKGGYDGYYDDQVEGNIVSWREKPH